MGEDEKLKEAIEEIYKAVTDKLDEYDLDDPNVILAVVTYAFYNVIAALADMVSKNRPVSVGKEPILLQYIGAVNYTMMRLASDDVEEALKKNKGETFHLQL